MRSARRTYACGVATANSRTGTTSIHRPSKRVNLTRRSASATLKALGAQGMRANVARTNGRLMIRIGLLGPNDAPELFAAFERSRTLHEPWVTPPASEAELRDSLGAPPEIRLSYGIRVDDGSLAGVVNINPIIRGAFQQRVPRLLRSVPV